MEQPSGQLQQVGEVVRESSVERVNDMLRTRQYILLAMEVCAKVLNPEGDVYGINQEVFYHLGKLKPTPEAAAEIAVMEARASMGK